MKIEIIRSDGSLMEFYLKGEDHTFVNLLVEELRQNTHVKFVGYSIDHPILYARKPRVKVITDGKVKPEEVLEEAAQKIFDRARALLDAWKKALEG